MSKNAVVAACLFIACQEEHAPRTEREIAAVAKESHVEISHAIKLINIALNREKKRIAPEELLSRFCGRLCLSFNVIKRAQEFLKRFKNNKALQNVLPETITAASIYWATDKKVTQKVLAENAGINVQTLSRLVSRLSK